MPSHKGIACQCLTEVGFLEVQCWLSGDRPKLRLLVLSGAEGFLFFVFGVRPIEHSFGKPHNSTGVELHITSLCEMAYF